MVAKKLYRVILSRLSSFKPLGKDPTEGSAIPLICRQDIVPVQHVSVVE